MPLLLQGETNPKVPILAFQPPCATCSCVSILPGSANTQGFVAAFATGEHRARGAAASRWKIIHSQSFPVIPSHSQLSAGCSPCCVALHRTCHSNIYHQGKPLPPSGEGHCGDVNLELISLSLSMHLYIYLFQISSSFPLPAHSGLQDAFVTCCRQLPALSSLLQITQSQQQSYVRMKPKG